MALFRPRSAPEGESPDPQQLADQDLAQQAVRGDTTAFNRLVLRHQDAVYTLCVRLTGNVHDAADAAQDAFFSAFRNLAGFRGGQVRSWLLRIAANSCYDLHRSRARRPADSLDQATTEEGAPPAVVDPAAGPEQEALRHELGRVIQAGLMQLPESQRLAVVLCDVHGYDYQSIAEITGVDVGTVKSRINRGRRRLRDHLAGVRELLPSSKRPVDVAPVRNTGAAAPRANQDHE